MADLDDAAVVRELASTEIGKMTNAQLKRALTAALGAERSSAEPSIVVLLEELRSLREELVHMKRLAQRVEHMSESLNKAYEIIHN